MASQNSMYTDRVNELSEEEFKELQLAVRSRSCKNLTGFSSFDEAASLFRGDPICPECQSRHVFRDGTTSLGRQRYRCADCRESFSYLVGTIFENNRKNFPVWVDFFTYMVLGLPIAEVAQLCHVTNQTAYQWRDRMFSIVGKFQNNVKLRGKIWIEEVTMFLPRYTTGFDVAMKRGPIDKAAYAVVAIDEQLHPVAIALPGADFTKEEALAALSAHIEEGSVIAGHEEKSLGILAGAAGARALSLSESEADQRLKVYRHVARNFTTLLRRFLPCIGSVNADKLQPHLDWIGYLVWMKREEDKTVDLGAVMRHLMMVDAMYCETSVFVGDSAE